MQEVEKTPSVEMSEFPFVSVIVCTYNRKKLLKDCLNSIFTMDYPKFRYEVIIVDGGSTDGTEELLMNFPQIRFAIEKRFGLAFARNKGAEMAKGSIVAYTDDDCVVDRCWLNALVSGLQSHPYYTGIGGPVYPLNPDAVPKNIQVKAALGLFEEGNKQKLVPIILTSNSAFRREIFNKVRFDETLRTTRRGKFILSGEDVDFCQKLIETGHKILYDPHAIVYHQIRMDRLRVRYILQHAIGHGVSTTLSILKTRNSRVWTVRVAVGMIIQSFLAALRDRSFTSCYRIIMSLSTLLVSITSLDKIIFRTSNPTLPAIH